jgi:hypothetical protein
MSRAGPIDLTPKPCKPKGFRGFDGSSVHNLHCTKQENAPAIVEIAPRSWGWEAATCKKPVCDKLHSSRATDRGFEGLYWQEIRYCCRETIKGLSGGHGCHKVVDMNRW